MVTKYVMMFGTYFQSSTMAISCFLTVQRFGDERQSMPRFFFYHGGNSRSMRNGTQAEKSWEEES